MGSGGGGSNIVGTNSYKECSNQTKIQQDSQQSYQSHQSQEQLISSHGTLSHSHHPIHQHHHYPQNVVTLSSLDRYNPNSLTAAQQSYNNSNNPSDNINVILNNGNSPTCRCPTLIATMSNSDSNSTLTRRAGGPCSGPPRFNRYEGLPQTEYEMSDMIHSYQPSSQQQLIVNTFNYGELPYEQSSSASSSTVTGLYVPPPPTQPSSSSSTSAAAVYVDQPSASTTLSTSSAAGGAMHYTTLVHSTMIHPSSAQLNNISSTPSNTLMMSPTNRVITVPIIGHAYTTTFVPGTTAALVNSETQTGSGVNSNGNNNGNSCNNSSSSTHQHHHHHTPYINYDYNEYSDISQF